MTTPRYGSWLDTSARDMQTEVIPLDRRGPKRLWDAPAGYVTRHRGVSTVKNTYVCPVHGAFEARSDEASVRCPKVLTVRDAFAPPTPAPCGLASPWSPSPFSVWASSGEVKS